MLKDKSLAENYLCSLLSFIVDETEKFQPKLYTHKAQTLPP
jgi:hypothetical protein